MAQLKITIEGEMTPEEMRHYIATAWGALPPSAVQIEQEEPPPFKSIDAETLARLERLGEAVEASKGGTVKVPVEVIPEVVPVPEVEAGPDDLVAKLNECKKLSQLLQVLVEEKGAKTAHELIEFCKHYRAQVPNLERLGAGLEDRVTRTFEGMR